MNFHHIPWEPLILGLFKLLKTFGLIPGAFAAFSTRKLYQKWRQNRAIFGWPVTDATIHSGFVRGEGWRTYWVEVTYSYYVGEYRAGRYVRKFHRAGQAKEFLRQVSGKRVMVHYDSARPDTSVILDRDVELLALLAPQFG